MLILPNNKGSEIKLSYGYYGGSVLESQRQPDFYVVFDKKYNVLLKSKYKFLAKLMYCYKVLLEV